MEIECFLGYSTENCISNDQRLPIFSYEEQRTISYIGKTSPKQMFSFGYARKERGGGGPCPNLLAPTMKVNSVQ